MEDDQDKLAGLQQDSGSAGGSNTDEGYRQWSEQDEEYLDECLKGPFLHELARDAFVSALVVPVALDREDFKARFRAAFKTMDLYVSPDPALIEMLFDEAVLAHKQLGAWSSTLELLKSQEFDSTLRYVRGEAKRFSKVRSLLRGEASETLPTSNISKWQLAHIYPFETSAVRIAGELQHTKDVLEELAELRALGRQELESYLLLRIKQRLRSGIGAFGTGRLDNVLAAFAHASRLVPSGKSKDQVAKIKGRVSRARRSESQLKYAWSFLSFITRQESSYAVAKLISKLPKEPDDDTHGP